MDSEPGLLSSRRGDEEEEQDDEERREKETRGAVTLERDDPENLIMHMPNEVSGICIQKTHQIRS